MRTKKYHAKKKKKNVEGTKYIETIEKKKKKKKGVQSTKSLKHS